MPLWNAYHCQSNAKTEKIHGVIRYYYNLERTLHIQIRCSSRVLWPPNPANRVVELLQCYVWGKAYYWITVLNYWLKVIVFTRSIQECILEHSVGQTALWLYHDVIGGSFRVVEQVMLHYHIFFWEQDWFCLH